MSWESPCKARIIRPQPRVELYIGPKMDMLEVARILAQMQRDRPDKDFYIDGTHKTIVSRPRGE